MKHKPRKAKTKGQKYVKHAEKVVTMHPIAVAWNKWIQSEEGKSCLCDTASGQYLENRLWKAFVAGADGVTITAATAGKGKR